MRYVPDKTEVYNIIHVYLVRNLLIFIIYFLLYRIYFMGRVCHV